MSPHIGNPPALYEKYQFLERCDLGVSLGFCTRGNFRTGDGNGIVEEY
jgi:hypothetical protein